MAIRFRCRCGQKLRVGDEKAGLQAKCPKCRSTVMVPSVSPVPSAASVAPVEQAVVKSPVAPEPPGTPAASAPPLSPPESAPRSSRGHPVIDVGRPEESEDALPEIVIRDDSADWLVSPSPPTSAEESSIDYDKIAVPRRFLYLQGGLLAVVALLSFILGVLVGGSRSPSTNGAGAVRDPAVLSGQVTAVAGDQTRPDDGSVVIVLPVDRRPGVGDRVAIDGLRPRDPVPIDSNLSLRAIRSLGGDCVRTTEDGRFHLRLPQDGPYFVLVISRRAARSATDKLQMSDVAQIGRYFDNVVDLLEDRRYQWRQVAMRGDTILDATF